MGSLWHKPNEIRNVENILKTKSAFPHLVAFDYDSALHYKTSEHVSRVGREKDEILTTWLAYSQLCDKDYYDTVAEYEVTAYDPPLSLDKLWNQESFGRVEVSCTVINIGLPKETFWHRAVTDRYPG